MPLLNKEQILERGWSEEIFESLTENKGQVIKQGENFWHLNSIEKFEKSDKFKLSNQLKALEEATQHGINFVQSLNIDFKSGNHLLAKKDDYNTLKPIFHLVKNDFAPDENTSYTMFTDGTFKTVDKKSFASCGGWIIDNKTKEVVIEFSKVLELNENNSRGMPKFELLGIAEGVKFANQLGLKNVQCYTDSNHDAKKIFLAIHNFYMQNNQEDEKYKELYESIAKNLKDSNSSIAWISREYNTHADELSEIPLKTWEKQNDGEYKEKDYIAEHGYKVNRDEVIYLHQDKADFKDYQDLENPLTLVITNKKEGNKQYMVSLIYDNISNKLSVLEAIPRDFSYIDESLPEEIKKIKKVKQDSINLMYLARSINNANAKNLGNINICVPPLITAVDKRATPIPSDLQEEFFTFHKALQEYPGKITMTHKWSKLDKRIKDYLQVVEEKNIEENPKIKKVKPK